MGTYVEFACKRCGKLRTIKPSEIARGGGKHCSQACYDASRAVPRTGCKTCSKCGESKPVEKFSQRSGRPAGQRDSRCTTCVGRIGRPYREIYAAKIRAVRVPRKTGRPAMPAPERFAKRYQVNASGCWLWLGGTSGGYGQFFAGVVDGVRTRVYAHRFSYELHVGKVPSGLQLDHLCRVRRCVNPTHLEPVTAQVNTLRGNTLQARNKAKTQCPKGHVYDKANTRLNKNGGRACKACERERNAVSRLRCRSIGQ